MWGIYIFTKKCVLSLKFVNQCYDYGYTTLPFWVRVDLGVIPMKRVTQHSTELQNWILATGCSLVSYQRHLILEGSFYLSAGDAGYRKFGDEFPVSRLGFLLWTTVNEIKKCITYRVHQYFPRYQVRTLAKNMDDFPKQYLWEWWFQMPKNKIHRAFHKNWYNFTNSCSNDIKFKKYVQKQLKILCLMF